MTQPKVETVEELKRRLAELEVRWRDAERRAFDASPDSRAVAEAGRLRFRQLADAMPLLVWTLAADGSPDYFNQRWVHFTGVQRDWLTALHPDDVERTRAAWQRALASGEGFGVEHRVCRNDGHYQWFLTRGVPLREQGTIVRWIVTGTDIDQQKGLEHALKDQTVALETILSLEEGDAELLRRTNDELERRVAERTRELEVANVRLTEMDRLKSDFLATMSHELRTPLNSIIGFTGIILQGLAGDINDEQRKQLTLVYNAGQHLLKLISEILDVSRIESGKARIQMEQFDLGMMVHHVVDSLEVMIGEKGLEVVLQGPTEGLVVRSDRQKLTQVLLNLMGNAIKFTPQGCITVSWRQTAGHFEVTVQDTGIGIRAEDRKHLFEPFRQLEATSHRTYEGTGLGLYLSRKLAQLLGGDITVDSTHGQGSRFTVVLAQGADEGGQTTS